MKIIVVIRPCLLGFELRIIEHYSERVLGIFESFSDILSFLIKNWKLDFELQLQ